MITGHTQAGGGIMGVGPACYVAALEEATGLSVQTLTDFFAGTSAGAINTGLYACDYGGKAVLDFHRAHGGDCFADKNWRYRLIKCGPRFDDAKILALLKKYCGDRTMSETVKPLYVTAWDMQRKQLKVFGPADTTVPVWYAVRCSMAAPTYFGNMDGRYADGGMAANDPALVGFAGVVMDDTLDITAGIKLLNLVTSGTTPPRGPVRNDLLVTTYLSSVVLPALTAGNSADVEFIRRAIDKFVRAMTGKDAAALQNFRVAPDCPDYDLADTSCVEDVERRWRRWFETDRDAVSLYFTGAPAKSDAGPELATQHVKER